MSHPHALDRWLHGLPEPVKNRFFYGMLLNEENLSRDQHHFDGLRWLLNRLTLGIKGVLAGLDYKFYPVGAAIANGAQGDDKATGPRVVLAPGVAVDGYGREIVVPSTISEHCRTVPVRVGHPHRDSEVAASDAAAFVDAAAAWLKMSESELRQFDLLIEIRRDPAETDHVPIRAGCCPTKCEPSAIREGFHVRFRPLKTEETPPLALVPGAPDEEPARSAGAWPGDRPLIDVFPLEPEEAIRHRQLAQLHADLAAPAVAAPPPDGTDPYESHDLRWVPLGVLTCDVTWDIKQVKGVKLTNRGRFYRQVFSNDALSRLVFGLAERVDEAARVRVLTFDTKPLPETSGQGQTANVYAPLSRALSVEVINSLDPTASKADLGSVQVQFEVLTEGGGVLSATDFNPSLPYDPTGERKPLLMPVDGTTGTAQVYWRLGKAPGPHTVVARIVPVKPEQPPFHPGSQLLFHATARPTAPTIVGIDFDHLWCTDHCGKYWWNNRGHCQTLRLTFSRRLEEGGVALLADHVRVWAIHRRHAHGHVFKPRHIRLRVDMDSYRPACEANDENARKEVCWQVDCHLYELVEHLHPSDVLRVAVLISVPDFSLLPVSSPPAAYGSPLHAQSPLGSPYDSTLVSVSSGSFPTPQALDPTFDGSFLSLEYRQRLWGGDAYLAPPKDEDRAVEHSQGPSPPQDQGKECEPEPAGSKPSPASLFWNRFRPRERCLPSGDGKEGGVVEDGTDFHKTFEFRLPCC
jgi:hypothetical protein